ncbi:2,3-dimethylmalate dehydratase large subunit [Planctomycetes bacterium Poly30]|uniref:Aconitate hydratase A n=1 Tax=Saltatorellus ferox TaxID=2528018 RepID=A0A518EY00_9BACT|nr:2,3-dimethylmalate dehydratase large subunit [Planctomycetes bacterium Poly30]
MNTLIHELPSGERVVRLSEGKRVLFLTKDLELIRKQLRGELNMRMEDVDPADLLDDINTDTMTPAWVCFRHKPEDIALDAYAGLLDSDGKRVFETRDLLDGGFEVIVSGKRKGTGSSRETAPQCEKWSGIHLVIAHSFAPIHERNNLNLGQLMAGYGVLTRLQNGEDVPLDEITKDLDPITRVMLESGGLFPFAKLYKEGLVNVPVPDTAERPMTMAEKMLSAKVVGPGGEVAEGVYLKPGNVCLVNVDGGYSHEFTTAQVHHFLELEYGEDYTIPNPAKFGVFEDHLLYATGVERMKPFTAEIQLLRDLQIAFQKHTGVRDYSAKDGVSPGICHQVAREEFVDPGDFIQATDSHTCMGGGNNALTYGVGATEYAGLISAGFTFVEVPESIRFELTGELDPGVTAKDVMLHILDTYAKREDTLDRVMEFGGPGLASLSADERATLCNMATECSAKSGICEGDRRLAEWLQPRRSGETIEQIEASFVAPDAGAEYAGGTHTIDLSKLKPMVAEPGDPTYGKDIADLGDVKIDIAYAGSCTAGKEDDFEFYARVLKDALDSGRKVKEGVKMVVQYGSMAVRDHAKAKGYDEIFRAAGVEVIAPGCGACIGCGPGVSETKDEVTVSAINRNFRGRSGPGQLYLASPLTVAASAIEGRIVAYTPGMFRQPVNA